MTKRDLGFNHKVIDRSLRKIPRFYLYITVSIPKHQFQTSIKFVPKFKILVDHAIAYIKEVEKF